MNSATVKFLVYTNIAFMVIMALSIGWFMNIIFNMKADQEAIIEEQFVSFLEQFDVEIIE